MRSIMCQLVHCVRLHCRGMDDKQQKRNWPSGNADSRSSKRQKRVPAKLVVQDDDWEEVISQLELCNLEVIL
jgi:hypothetical protein